MIDSTNHLTRLAGAVGFEPTIHDIKNRCLTAWLRPITLENLTVAI